MRRGRSRIELNAFKNGIIEEVGETNSHADRMSIGRAIDEYPEFVKAHRKSRTYLTYRYTLGHSPARFLQ
jgi:hypothetical protein